MCQNASASTGLITLQIWPTLKFPPNYPERSNFSLSCYNNDPFLLPPSFFSVFFFLSDCDCVGNCVACLQLGPLSVLAVIAAICSIIVVHPSKTPSGRESVYVLTWPADKHTFFISPEVIQPRGKVLHNTPWKMYDTITSARQLTLNLAALSAPLTMEQ